MQVAQGQNANGEVFGFVSFAVSELTVEEGAPGATGTTIVRIPLVREVGSSGVVLATIEVSQRCNNDETMWIRSGIVCM